MAMCLTTLPKAAPKYWPSLGSNGYGALILFNRLVNFVLKAFGREKLSISKNVMASVNKMAKIDDFEQIAAELAIEKKYDYVICGHIHQPQKRVIENEKGKVTYLNSGDWVEHLTAPRIPAKRMADLRIRRKRFPANGYRYTSQSECVNRRDQFLH